MKPRSQPDQNKDSRSKAGSGLTPGGFRPTQMIHKLAAGDVVTRERVERRKIHDTSQRPASKDRRQLVNLVLTPGGYRHPSLVHKLEKGHGVTRTGNVLQKFDQRTGRPIEQPIGSAQFQVKPALGSGWITDSSITNTTGTPFYFFSTTWTVPSAPASDSGQTIFLFNALMDAAKNDILQPVLQWGPSQAGGGSYWSIACWFIDSSGNAFYHDLIEVNVGDTLTGIMFMTGQSGGTFNYNCFFQGIDNTELVINNISELVVATETLECYGIEQCSNYPNTNFTAMAGIDIKAASAGTPAAPGSRLDGYWGSDYSQHVNFIDGNGHIHELYIHPGAGWVNNDLTGFTQGALAAPGSALDGYWGSDNSQHVNFIDGNGHIHELYIRPGVGWVDNDLTAFSQGTPAAPGSALDGYWGSDNSQHVNFIDGNGHIHELYIHPGTGWTDNDLTAFSQGTPAAPGSALDGYWGSDNSQHVNFIDGNGHIHELYIHPGAGWVDNDLTGFSQGTPAAPGSALDGYWGSDNSQHVNFIDGNGHIHELYIHPGVGWVDNDLTDFSQGTPAAPGSALDGYWGSDNSQHVNFIDSNGHIHELYIHPGAGWVDNDLTGFSQGTPAAPGSALDGYWGSDNSQHVNFVDGNGHIHELYIHPGIGWVDNDLTQFGGADMPLAWQVQDRVTDCGQHTDIASNASPGGQVDLWFKPEPAWQQFQLAPDGSASMSGKIAAVSRIPGSMETWWIGEDGSVQGAFWYDGGQWQRYQLAPPGSASTTGGITALSRISNSMEVWWVGPDGSIQDAFWYEGGQWQRFELAPTGSASTTSGIKGVHRIPSSMELWWVGPDGSIQDAFWYEGAQWQRFELAPAGSASTASGIGAVSRISNSMELWWVGPDGSVQDAYWYDGGQWQRFELAPSGSASTASGIGAVSRISNSMELWWVGPDGSVQDAYWYDGGHWQRFELAPAGSASTASGIGAVSRISNSMELWWVGPDGSVQDAYWYDGGQWQRFELAPAGSASTASGIAAVSRIPNSMELWWDGASGSIQDAYWYG